MLEVGLALIACCLPSLRNLATFFFQSVYRNVRSAAYAGSSGSKSGSKALQSHVPKRNESTASNVAMVRDHPERHTNITEAYALEEGLRKPQEIHHPELPRDGIWVKKTFDLDDREY